MPLPDDIGMSSPVAIVTGANCGVGFEVARQLSSIGYSVVLGCRSKTRCFEALARIMEERDAAANAHRWGAVEMLQLDLADHASVEKFVSDFSQRHTSLDALVNNAGIGGFGRTAEPAADVPTHDLVFRTNFLGHFQLTLALLPLLRAAPDARIVNTGSVVHRSVVSLLWGEPAWGGLLGGVCLAALPQPLRSFACAPPSSCAQPRFCGHVLSGVAPVWRCFVLA